jgi:hypothetical protein
LMSPTNGPSNGTSNNARPSGAIEKEHISSYSTIETQVKGMRQALFVQHHLDSVTPNPIVSLSTLENAMAQLSIDAKLSTCGTVDFHNKVEKLALDLFLETCQASSAGNVSSIETRDVQLALRMMNEKTTTQRRIPSIDIIDIMTLESFVGTIMGHINSALKMTPAAFLLYHNTIAEYTVELFDKMFRNDATARVVPD